MKCNTCKFWDPAIKDDPEYGVCRRYAPPPRSVTFAEDDAIRLQERLKLEAPMFYGEWAQTAYSDWCGEWQPKECA